MHDASAGHSVAVEVGEGVHRVELPVPGGGVESVNVYVLVTVDGPVLIDSGWHTDEAERRLGSGLAELGYEMGDVRMYLITHIHRDHFEMGLRLRERFGSRVLLGASERASLELLIARPPIDEMPMSRRMREAGAEAIWYEIQALRRRPWVTWELPDSWLEPDQVVAVGDRTLRVIATPGHTQGHIVFADADNGTLFSGDHILPSITPSIGFESAPVESALDDFLASLHAIRALPDMRLMPAHGRIAPSTHVRIDELLGHHEERLTQTDLAVAHGARTALETAGTLSWNRHRAGFDDLDGFHQMLAVNETKAHLDVLVERGLLERTEEGGIHLYMPATLPEERSDRAAHPLGDRTATWA